jgi:spoIIIJ-associated protein
MTSRTSALETLELLLQHLGQTFEIREEQRPMGFTLHVLTSDSSSLLERNAKSLDDLQYLLNRIIHQGEDDEVVRVLVDMDHFRQKQYEDLIAQVDAVAARVLQSGREETLAPMNSFERRLVHHHFQDHAQIQSVSPKSEERVKSMTLRQRA